MQLRPYQNQAVQAVYSSLRDRGDNPCVVIPTGGGKTLVLAQLCWDIVNRWNCKVVVLAHVKELLQQGMEKLSAIYPQAEENIGIYSAGLDQKDSTKPITFAGIQSAFRNPQDFDDIDFIIVDEAHRIPEDGDGMYRSFIDHHKKRDSDIPVCGLTATDYRTKTGKICKPENILNHVCYEISVKELMDKGYLCPVKSKGGENDQDWTKLRIQAGDFKKDDLENLFNSQEIIEQACKEIAKKTESRNSVLIFCSGVEHAENISAELGIEHGLFSECVFGHTAAPERERILNDFKSGKLKYLINVGVLTEGFDAPNIDCVCLLRATMSPALYYQMVGRGFRLFEGKDYCLALDFGGNVQRHGPVDAIQIDEKKPASKKGDAPVKKCPNCGTFVHISVMTCPDCKYEWEEKVAHHSFATDEDIISNGPRTLDVMNTTYHVHTKKGALQSDPKTMRVTYVVGFNQTVSEWVCFEHSGYARGQAEKWWKKRSHAQCPPTSIHAVKLANEGALPTTLKIKVKKDGKYDRIIGHVLDNFEPEIIAKARDIFQEPDTEGYGEEESENIWEAKPDDLIF